MAIQSCSHGLLADAERESAAAALQAAAKLRIALEEDTSQTQLQRHALEALLDFFDRWSGAQVQAWSGLATVDEEATDLRAQITAKTKPDAKHE